MRATLGVEFAECFNSLEDCRQQAVGDVDYVLACFWRDTGRYFNGWYLEFLVSA
jgi:hypothetical protein